MAESAGSCSMKEDVVEHSRHRWARATLDRLLDHGDSLALAPQVLARFVHAA